MEGVWLMILLDRLHMFHSVMLGGMKALAMPKTEQDVAKELGFRKSLFDFWLDGRQLPSEAMVEKLAVACGVSQSELLVAHKETKEARAAMLENQRPKKVVYKPNPDCEVFGPGSARHRGNGLSATHR